MIRREGKKWKEEEKMGRREKGPNKEGKWKKGEKREGHSRVTDCLLACLFVELTDGSLV